MSADNVTPTDSGPTRQVFEVMIKDQIDKQQTRVWRLRSLIQCIAEQVEGSSPCDDILAATLGLADYADAIHNDLDSQDMIKRAKQAAADE